MLTTIFVLTLHACFADKCYSVMPLNQPRMTEAECHGVAPSTRKAWLKNHPHWIVPEVLCIGIQLPGPPALPHAPTLPQQQQQPRDWQPSLPNAKLL